jgi:inner membrane protein
MPSPVGHILGGVAVFLAGTKKECRSRFIFGITLLSSISPDFDFFPGILIGQMGAFHHGISHSLGFAILFGALVFLFVRYVEKSVAVQGAMLATLAYVTHVVLDCVGVNEGTRGVPILWPLSDERMGFGLGLFGHFRWGDIRDGIGTIIRWENVLPVLREILIVGSAVVLLFWREWRSIEKRR